MIWFRGIMVFSTDHRTPMSRIKDIYDRAEPAPNGVFIDCAVKLYERTSQLIIMKRHWIPWMLF